MVPCVLLMLQGRARDAGELRELVAAFGLRRQARGLEATLQGLQDDGLIHRTSEAAGNGDLEPRYELSTSGRRWLAARAHALDEPARLVARFLDRYAQSGVIPAVGLKGWVEAVGTD